MARILVVDDEPGIRAALRRVLVPEGDGLETMRELMAEFPDACVVMISGGGRFQQVELLAAATALGARAVLPKPFQNEELLQLVRELLGESG